MNEVLGHAQRGHDGLAVLPGSRQERKRDAQERGGLLEPLANELDRHRGPRGAIERLPDCRGEDLRLAFDLQVLELLVDHVVRVPPVLEAHRRLPRIEGNRVLEVQERIQSLGLSVSEREDVAPAEQIHVFHRDDAPHRAHGRGLVVVDVQEEAEGLSILNLHVKHALARPEAGLEVYPEALDPRIVEEQLDLALELVDIERGAGREAPAEIAGPEPPVTGDVDLAQPALDDLVGHAAIPDGLVGEDHPRMHVAPFQVQPQELEPQGLQVLLGEIPVLVTRGDLCQGLGGEGGVPLDDHVLDEDAHPRQLDLGPPRRRQRREEPFRRSGGRDLTDGHPWSQHEEQKDDERDAPHPAAHGRPPTRGPAWGSPQRPHEASRYDRRSPGHSLARNRAALPAARAVGGSPSALGRRPPGSRGSPSRPATTRLLDLPSARRAEQEARISAAASRTSAESSARLPLTSVTTALMLTVPGELSADDAVTAVSMGVELSITFAKILILPPGPPKASAWMPP